MMMTLKTLIPALTKTFLPQMLSYLLSVWFGQVFPDLQMLEKDSFPSMNDWISCLGYLGHWFLGRPRGGRR